MKKLISALAFFAAAQFALADAHIFNYHRFDDDRHPSTNISSKNLREQFEYFKEKGCHVFTIENDLIDLHLFTPVTIEEKKLNREILLRLNSKEVNLLKIKNIYQTIEKK